MKQPKTGGRKGGTGANQRALQLLNDAAGLLAKGRADEAIPLLQRAHRLDRDSAPILLNLGGAYIMTGRYPKAVFLLEAARDAEPDNAMVWTNLGAAYLGNPVLASAEQQARAIHAFEQAIRLNPGAANVYYNLGLIYVDRGEPEQAREAFARALQANPMDHDSQLWLIRLGSRDIDAQPGEP